MSPPRDCGHVCCADRYDLPHVHEGPEPESCKVCKDINDPQQPARTPGQYQTDKAFRVASKRHPEAFPQPKEDS